MTDLQLYKECLGIQIRLNNQKNTSFHYSGNIRDSTYIDMIENCKPIYYVVLSECVYIYKNKVSSYLSRMDFTTFLEYKRNKIINEILK